MMRCGSRKAASFGKMSRSGRGFTAMPESEAADAAAEAEAAVAAADDEDEEEEEEEEEEDEEDEEEDEEDEAIATRVPRCGTRESDFWTTPPRVIKRVSPC
jgi:predicted  nucleic acid-binding Zn-ribbon protein